MGAILSQDGERRYRLDRQVGSGCGCRTCSLEGDGACGSRDPTVLWVMLNPSTADASTDDPTIRRVLRFSARERFGRVVVCNLHSIRATDPRTLHAEDSDGEMHPDDQHIAAAAREAHTVIVAWGSHAARWPRRCGRVWNLLVASGGGASPFPRGLWCLGTTANGHPRHPLYLRADEPLTLWAAPRMVIRGC